MKAILLQIMVWAGSKLFNFVDVERDASGEMVLSVKFSVYDPVNGDTPEYY